ncbi:MAG TPA: PQQ-binding-like beta-propeller repeat protein [Candidatus Limnocylindrales bacterium]|nr:PQQ-binding-like beta-propeller repeat protein [Candidatus Limnocylindrales bacterium]
MTAVCGIASWLGLGLLGANAWGADWPMLRGNAQHNGFVPTELKPPYKLIWAREIEGERLGTAMEPIVSDGKLLVATHAGKVYALDVASGNALWCFQARGPFLQSPAVAESVVCAASTDGQLYGLEINSGKLAWRLAAGTGGLSAAPEIADGVIYIGTRSGDFLAVSVKGGRVRWRQSIGVPIRQTAAIDEGLVYITAEDLKVRCFRAEDGKLAWSSEPLTGQTARDYYPVVIRHNGRRFVILRTNPVLNMGQRIARDRTMLCRNAGVDDSSWEKVDKWIRSDAVHGTPELWAKEQAAIVRYVQDDRSARTFFVLDGETGKEASIAPVLWIGGCQGVGAEPAQTADGGLLLFYRSAYGNWNQGVAPLVALGLLDLATDRIAPLLHQQGRQPHWNCFWGTADESQNFLVAGGTAIIIHQGTLSGFDLTKSQLFPICGERDTFGGFRNPSWARNEWHGPARGGVAVVGERIYWQSGSRILCLAPEEPGAAPNRVEPVAIQKDVPTSVAPKSPGLDRETFRRQLVKTAKSLLTNRWAPLFTDPGLAGRVFSFDNSGELFETIAWAYPHLPPELRSGSLVLLRSEWTNHPPFTSKAWYSLKDGLRREWFWVPTDFCERLASDKRPHPFGNLQSVWFFAQRCKQEQFILERWPELKAAYEDFNASHWHLDPDKGDEFANRYLASLWVFSRIAKKAGALELAAQARGKADATAQALVDWWKRATEKGTLKTFNGSSELDAFIGKGDGIFLALAPHRHTLGLFQDLTPEIAELLRAQAPAAVERVWQTFDSLCPTWHLAGEERQVHFGENFVDPPVFALSAFRALKWLKQASGEQLSRRVDLPFCRADLYYMIKLSLALEDGDLL